MEYNVHIVTIEGETAHERRGREWQPIEPFTIEALNRFDAENEACKRVTEGGKYYGTAGKVEGNSVFVTALYAQGPPRNDDDGDRGRRR